MDLWPSDFFILVVWSVEWNLLFFLLTTRINSTILQQRIALAAGCYTHLYAMLDESRKHGRIDLSSVAISAISIGAAIRTYLRARVA
jgi:hypothetical protein